MCSLSNCTFGNNTLTGHSPDNGPSATLASGDDSLMSFQRCTFRNISPANMSELHKVNFQVQRRGMLR